MKMKLPAFASVLLAASCLGSLLSCTSAPATVGVTGVSLSASTASVAVGASYQLTATVSPSDATTATVSWSSSDTTIATVSSAGLVSGVAAGSATITVKTDDGGYSATCAVTVTKTAVAATGIGLNQTSISLAVGATYMLIAKATPADATTPSLSWSSDAASIATVDSGGTVTGVAVGSATITVKTSDGKFSASCAVTVTNKGTVPSKVGQFATDATVRSTYSSSYLSEVQSAFVAAYQKALDAGFNPGTPEYYTVGFGSNKANDGFYQAYSGGDSSASGKASAECCFIAFLHGSSAYLLKNDFYAYCYANGKLSSPKLIGDPISDEYVNGSYRYQDFLCGRLSEPASGGSVNSVSWTPYDGTSTTGYAQPVRFSHVHGGYSTSAARNITLTLSALDYSGASISGASISGASIYYTTDGSVPTTSSTLYSSALTISSSSLQAITAIAVVSGVSSYPVAKDFAVVVPTSPELLANGSFSSGLLVWNAYSDEASSADPATVHVSLSSGVATISTERAGINWWSRQFMNFSDVDLEKGSTYQVSFDAWTDGSSRQLQVLLTESGIDSDGDGNLYESHGGSIVTLSSTRTTYTVVVAMSDATDAYGRLVFNYGLDATTFHLASVSVKKVDSSNGATFNISACTRIEVGDFGRYFVIPLHNVTSAWAYFDIPAARTYTVDIVNPSSLTATGYPQKAGDPSQPDMSAPTGSQSSSGVYAGSYSAIRYFIYLSQSSADWNDVSIKVY